MQASHFLGREALVRAKVPKLSRWRRWLYGVMARDAVPATEFFRIPSDRVVEFGVRAAIQQSGRRWSVARSAPRAASQGAPGDDRTGASGAAMDRAGASRAAARPAGRPST